jgi:hypothetical protein
MKVILVDNGGSYSDYTVYGVVIFKNDDIDTSVIEQAAKGANKDHSVMLSQFWLDMRNWELDKEQIKPTYPEQIDIFVTKLRAYGIECFGFPSEKLLEVSLL